MLILLTIHYPCYYFSSPGSFLVLLSPDPRHGRCGEQAFRLRQGQGGQAVGNVFFFGASDPTIKDTLSWCHDVYCENSWKLRMTWAFWGGSDPTFRRLFHCDRCHPRPRPASLHASGRRQRMPCQGRSQRHQRGHWIEPILLWRRKQDLGSRWCSG